MLPGQTQGQNLNLIRQIPAGRVARPPGFYQSLLLDALTVAAAFGVNYTYGRYLAGTLPFIWVLTFASVFALCSSFAMLLSRHFGRRILVLFLETAALISLFVDRPQILLLSAAGAGFALLFLGDLAAYRALKNSLEIRFLPTVRLQSHKLVTALLVMGILFYLPQWEAEDSFLPKKSFQAMYDWASGVGNRLYPELRFNGTVEEFARSLARSQLQTSSEFRLLAPPAQEKSIEAVSGQLTQNLGRVLGITIVNEQPLGDLWYNLAIEKLTSWRERLGNWFLFLWAAAAFFVLKGVGMLFAFALSGIAFFLYQLLLAMGAIRIVGESRMQEVLEYS